MAQPSYTLDSGDRLRVVIFGQEGLTNAYSVDAGGFIDMPLIGPVPARGATTDELAGRISEKLRDGFIREPHVAVEVEAYRPFFILGEVTQPGQYPYVANMTAETAVAIAGGLTPRALRRGVIVNRNNYGHPVRMSVPLTFPLRPGDTVTCKSAGSRHPDTSARLTVSRLFSDQACSEAAAAADVCAYAASVLARPLKKRLSTTDTIAARRIPDSSSGWSTSGV